MSKEQWKGASLGDRVREGGQRGGATGRSCEMGRPLVFMEGYDLNSMLADPLSSERCPDSRGKARSTGTSEEGLDHSRGEKQGPDRVGAKDRFHKRS